MMALDSRMMIPEVAFGIRPNSHSEWHLIPEQRFRNNVRVLIREFAFGVANVWSNIVLLTFLYTCYNMVLKLLV